MSPTRAFAKRDSDVVAMSNLAQPPCCVGPGEIDRSEFKLLMKELCIPMTARQLTLAMRSMDRDGSGSINFEEFCSWYLGESRPERLISRGWRFTLLSESVSV